ncbi:MAG: spore cortex biosynthesis protein YabQ [Clostridiales bacterium]|nr:spore cortex biosynthesis protein YabQ [Clostridiales bacterium]
MRFFALILGVMFGIFYDFLRILRLVFNSDFIFDLLFWVICSLATFSYLIVYDSGNIRAYYFVFMLVGFLLYIWTFGSISIKAERYIAKKVKIRLKK